MKKRIVFLSLLAAFTVMFARGGQQEARAMAIGKIPFKLEVWVPEERLVLGEPLVVHYRITNLANAVLSVNLWERERFPVWLMGTTFQSPGKQPVTLRSPSWLPGTMLGSPVIQPPPLERPLAPVDNGSGIFAPGVRRGPGQGYEGREVLSRWMGPLDPGRVDLRLVVQIPYEVEGPGSAAARGVLKVEKKISLLVGGRDPARLRGLARSLLKSLRTGSGVDDDTDLDLLLTLPAEDAGDAWRSLAGDRTIDADLHFSFVKALGQHDSVAAADILAGLAWDTAAEPGTRAAHAARHARDNLLNLHRKGSPVVKERARQHFLQREGTEPPQEVEPDDGDDLD